MSDEAVVLFANEAFYAAFASGDAEAMDQLWSRRETVTCIHPGWQTVTGRESVMETWTAILGGGSAPSIACKHATARALGDTAYVLCYEVVGSSVLAATNVFVREDGTWRLVHHQAGASSLPKDAPDDDDQSPIMQ